MVIRDTEIIYLEMHVGDNNTQKYVKGRLFPMFHKHDSTITEESTGTPTNIIGNIKNYRILLTAALFPVLLQENKLM